jgi:hypothetical protein
MMNRRKRTAGTALVETSLSLLLYTTIIFSLVDFGYIMYLHQTLVERARAAARYGSLNPTDTTGMKNVALYYSTTGSGPGVFGLTAANVSAVRAGSGTDADRVTISIFGYTYWAISPAVSKVGRAVTVSIPVENN